MDYSKNIEENIRVSWESDLAYARWYEKQPDERKVGMMVSGYEFAARSIRLKELDKNPFANKSFITSKFIEYTQKEDYPEEVFAFIMEKMQERSEKEWQARFKAMKKALGWTYENMATYMEAKNGASV